MPCAHDAVRASETLAVTSTTVAGALDTKA